MESSGGVPSPLSEDQRAELSKVRAEMQSTSAFLADLLMPWNHGGDPEYEDLVAAKEAADRAIHATERFTT